TVQTVYLGAGVRDPRAASAALAGATGLEAEPGVAGRHPRARLVRGGHHVISLADDPALVELAAAKALHHSGATAFGVGDGHGPATRVGAVAADARRSRRVGLAGRRPGA